jgi:hypothetical protein
MIMQTAVSNNPFITGFSVGYNMPETGTATFSLTNPNGTVIHESLVKADKGYNTYTFDTYAYQDETLEPGLYFLTLNSEKLFQIVKILKQ